MSPIDDHHTVHGGDGGVLGPPTGPELGTPDGIGRFRPSLRGSIYWTPTTGPREIHGAILATWAGLGFERSGGLGRRALTTAARCRLHERTRRYHDSAGDRRLRELEGFQTVTAMWWWCCCSEKREAEDSEHRWPPSLNTECQQTFPAVAPVPPAPPDPT